MLFKQGDDNVVEAVIPERKVAKLPACRILYVQAVIPEPGRIQGHALLQGNRAFQHGGQQESFTVRQKGDKLTQKGGSVQKLLRQKR